MLVNKKGQGAIVDLLILIIIVSLMVVFLGNQTTGRAIEAGRSRAQSAYVQRLLITTLDYSDDRGKISELIGISYGNESKSTEYINNFIEETITTTLNKTKYYYIFSICPENYCKNLCSDEIYEKYGECCIRTEKITLAFFNMSLPDSYDNDFVEIYLGVWPNNMRVEKC